MRRTPSQTDAAPESALARLLEVESRLEAMLEEARVDAEKIEARARREAEARVGRLATELAAADAELAATLAAESEAHIARERARLAGVRARYEAVDEERTAALSAWIVDEVLRLAGEGPP
jgi:hypothetical protein